MKIRIIISLIIAAVFACGNANSSKTEGEKIYGKYCIACHGENGQLAINGAKKFSESVLNLEERIEIISHGQGMMMAFNELLDEEEIAAVAEYTMLLSQQAED